MADNLQEQALATLKKHWGYPAFRPLQADIVMSVLSGCDTLGLMPTGGGKSITFQVPALMLQGVAIVVTPLISLMKDQVDNLKRRRIKAVSLHSGMSRREINLSNEKLFNGGAKFLYISPERLRNEQFLLSLRRLRICMIVVDEAHCISQWGYDFRPSYLGIAKLRKVAPDAPVLALTATATPAVADDICRQLQMTDPKVFRMSFTRDNINYIVRPSDTKISEVFHILSRTSGSAIVYVRSRKRTTEIADYLNAAGITAANYHAGLDYELKESRQNAWIRGAVRVMVATNAFGMGIDKPDVRVVIHYDLPPSLEEYYQEAGRAGRDGMTSYAVLLTAKTDQATLRRRISETFPDRDFIRKVYERVCNYLHISLGEGYDTLSPFEIERFISTFRYQPRQLLAALHLLGQAGYLEYMEEAEHRSRVMIICTREDLYHLSGLSANAEAVLTSLLRSYTGLFSDYVYISEENLSANLRIDTNQVYEALLELGRAKIASFIPRSRVPMVYLPTSREEPRYLVIGKNIYEERRDILKARTEAMIDYAFNASVCRENRLLVYFGETRQTRCGRCDTCRALRSSHQNDPEALIPKIMAYINAHPEGADFRIMERDIPADKHLWSQCLSFLCNEGHIHLHQDRYYPHS